MKAFAALVVVMAVAAVSVLAETERPAPGAKLVRPVIFGSRSQPVNVVPKGDPRAHGPTAPVEAVSAGLSQNAPFNGGRGIIAAPADVLVRADDIAAVRPKAARRALGWNFGNNRCIQQGGQCQLTNTCGGVVTIGICPGPKHITCCTYTSTKCAAIGGSCKDTSTCLGSVTVGLCPGGKNIACCTEKAGSTSTTPFKPQGGNCLANFNGPALATRALAYQAAYQNNNVRYDEARRQFGPAPITFSDASAFVTSVLDSLGWNCLFAVGRSVEVMNKQIAVRGGFHAAPRVGDLALWSDHAGIVIGGNTECPMSGAGGVRIVSMTQAGVSDTECVSVDALKTFGSGSFNGFWTPY